MRRTAVITISACLVGGLASGAWAAPDAAATFKARLSGPTSAASGAAVSFGLAKSSVPKGDKVLAYSLSFGDGTTKAGKGAEPRTQSHTFKGAGRYTVKLTLRDAEKKTSSASATITIKAPSTPTAPTAPPATAPAATAAASGVAVTSIIDPISPGSTEEATATGVPGDSCNLVVTLPSGRDSTAAGLGPETVDSTGHASWSWMIGTNTGAGTATASLSCGAGSTSRTFTIS